LKGLQRLDGLHELVEDSSVMGLDFSNELDLRCAFLTEHSQLLNVRRQRIDSLIGSVEPPVGSVEPLIDLVEPLVGSVEPLIDLVEPLVGSVEPLIDLVEPLIGLVEPLIGLVEPLVYPGEPLVHPLAERPQCFLDLLESFSYIWHRSPPSIGRCHGHAAAFFEPDVMVASFA
jgi:hypothetical protein